MAELETRDQALAYLATMSPTETFQVHPFRDGWVCTKVPTSEQMQSGEAVGSARLVIDSETGIIYVYPSLSTDMVAEKHMAFKETGIPAGRQIYPHQWRTTVRRTQEDEEKVVYQLTAESLIDPPEPSRQHLLTIEKNTYLYGPRDSLSRVAMAHARWATSQNQGVWPEVDTTEV